MLKYMIETWPSQLRTNTKLSLIDKTVSAHILNPTTNLMVSSEHLVYISITASGHTCITFS